MLLDDISRVRLGRVRLHVVGFSRHVCSLWASVEHVLLMMNMYVFFKLKTLLHVVAISRARQHVVGISRARLHVVGISMARLHVVGISRARLHAVGISRARLHVVGMHGQHFHRKCAAGIGSLLVLPLPCVCDLVLCNKYLLWKIHNSIDELLCFLFILINIDKLLFFVKQQYFIKYTLFKI